MSTRRIARSAMAGAIAALAVGTASAQAVTFTNSTNIKIPNTGTSGVSSPFPSTINVAGLSSHVYSVTARLNGFSHTFPADVDIALVGPTGARTILMADAGGTSTVTNKTVTFDDNAASFVPAPLVSGTFRPTYGSYDYSIPSGPFSPGLNSAFNAVNPNGTWKLYVYDDAGGDVGSISGGWTLNILTETTLPNGSYYGASSRTISRAADSAGSDVDASDVFLRGTASDNRGVTQVQVRVRSNSDVDFDQTYTASCGGCGPTSSPVNWSLNLTDLSPAPPTGSYSTQIIIRDQAGNVRTIAGPTVLFQP